MGNFVAHYMVSSETKKVFGGERAGQAPAFVIYDVRFTAHPGFKHTVPAMKQPKMPLYCNTSLYI